MNIHIKRIIDWIECPWMKSSDAAAVFLSMISTAIYCCLVGSAVAFVVGVVAVPEPWTRRPARPWLSSFALRWTVIRIRIRMNLPQSIVKVFNTNHSLHSRFLPPLNPPPPESSKLFKFTSSYLAKAAFYMRFFFYKTGNIWIKY